ncbi:hypothetical protein H6G33_37470 [Calothrix sp. FACHB-1219]|uniref:hypothetical protein n=1 Tax=unclassified Calothrix TaxID=2619626 RepID=UPI001681FA7F|nr:MULTISPECIES: hypothetical protein [unclassified Calothrix]MBD2208081.1 hypothetical protein [Calothrix sp. FACHB-168]MBD2222619.1 hypothetical protein [Calothrix sp. FACHB-1219]
MNGKLARRFAKILQSLPEEELLRFTATQAQREYWIKCREFNHIIAICFEARFSGKDNPIDYWKEDKTEKLFHDLVWKLIKMYEDLWSLIQVAFGDIKKAFDAKKEPLVFPSAWGLFLEVVKFQENSNYAQCLAPSCNTFNTKRDAKIDKLIRQGTWGELTEDQQAELKRLTKEQPVNPWLHIVYWLCQEFAKTDSLIAQHFQSFRDAMNSATDLQIKIYSQAIKGRLDFTLASEYWIDGKRHEGQQPGGKYS